MQREEYLCQVTIIEARHLAQTNPGQVCDPFIRIRCGNRPPQATTTEEGTPTPIWNQSFTFASLWLSNVEMQTFELIIEALDYNNFASNKLIGKYSIGLSTLHKQRNHEIFNAWLTLLNPEVSQHEAQGYLQINAFIVGPNDIPPIHTIGENIDLKDDEDEDDEILNPAKQREKKLMESKVNILGLPNVARKSYQLTVNIFKGESIKKESENAFMSSFVSVRVGGFVERTKIVAGTQDPAYNTKFNFPVYQPILNDKILIRVWDQKTTRDRLIAQVPNIPTDFDHFNISALLCKGGALPCRWFNLYGHPPNEDTTSKSIKYKLGMAKKSYTGSAFFGRILLSLSVTREDDPTYETEQSNPFNEPRANEYCLRFNVYDLNNAKGCGDNVWVRVSIGQFEVESANATKINDRTYQWGTSYHGLKLREIKQYFPDDLSQCPDIFIDLFTESMFGTITRIGYIRKKVTDCQGEENPRWMPIKSVDYHSESAGHSPGILLCSLAYGHTSQIGRRMIKSRPRKIKKWLNCLLYAGYDLAPGMDEEDVSATIELQFGNSKNLLKKSKICIEKCRNPVWKHQVVAKKVQLSENLTFEENLRVTVRTKTATFGRSKLIGSFSVPLMNCVGKESKLYFFHLVNDEQEGISQGKILAKFLISDNPTDRELDCNLDTHKCDITLAVIGARGLKPTMNNPTLKVSIPGFQHGKSEKEMSDAPIEINEDGSTAGKNSGSTSSHNFLQFVEFSNVDLPVDPQFLPVLKFSLEDKSFFGDSVRFTQTQLVPYADWVPSEKLKSDAIKAYNRQFMEKDKVEQIPNNELAEMLNVSTAAINRQVSDYSEQVSEGDIELEEKDAAQPLISNYQFGNTIEFDKNQLHEDIEEIKRTEMKVVLENKQEALYQQIADNFAKTQMKDPVLDKKYKKVKQKLEVIELGAMTEKRFQKDDNANSDSDSDDYDYGRPVMRTGLYDDVLDLPYKSFPLFKQTSNKSKLSMYKIGEKTSGILKVAIQITVQNAKVDEEKTEPTTTENPDKKKSKTTVKIEKKRFPMNFFDRDISPNRKSSPLFTHFRGGKAFKARLYLLRMLNLSAVDNKPDLVGLAGGYGAMSSADSYPEIFVGDRDQKQSGKTKYISEAYNRKENTLNPEFFQSWEFDVKLPEDYLMQFWVWDQGFIMDNLIGISTIDLEDRYFAKKSEEIMCAALIKAYQGQIDTSPNKKTQELYTQKLSDVNVRAQEITDKQVPVEYRQLLHPKKNTAQGLVEMWVETMTSVEARRTPMYNLVKPEPEKYELRLVIWRIEGVPFPEGKEAIDIFLECQWDEEGWISDSVIKKTDTHFGSEDGHGVYNYRLLFPFTLPSMFPRIRIMAYDFETFSDDIPLSEVVLDLSREFRGLQKEGRLEMLDQDVPMSLPNQPEKFGGRLYFSIWAVTRSEAENRPVGEGQEEPNRDPELEVPEEGRGMSDFLKGTALDPRGLFGWLNFGMFMKVLALFMFLFMLVVLFVYPGIMIK